MVTFLAVWPSLAHAAWWDNAEALSGPGPFKGWRESVRALCFNQQDRNTALSASTSRCLNDTSGDIQALVEAEVGQSWSRDQPRFQDTPTDTRGIRMDRYGVAYMYRVSPILDLGGGIGLVHFSGEGFDGFTKGTLTPIRVSFVPLGFLRKTDSATKWGRAVRVHFSEAWIVGGIDASKDFGSTSTYKKGGEFMRSFGIGIDVGSFLPKSW
jgi:hypothetical protein